jgi:hypothetical protein
MRNFLVAALMLLATGSMIAAAQEPVPKNEVAGTVGRTFVSDQGVPNAGTIFNTVHFGEGLTFEGTYARTFKRYSWGNLAAEVPVRYNADEDLNYGTNQIPQGYSSIFATPAARLTLIPDLAVSPWFSFGGGVGHFVASKNLQYYNRNPGPRIKTTGVLQGGVGMDVRLPKLRSTRFRFEARDDWSGVPPINVNTGKTKQHNYYVGGGLVFHF